MTRGGPKWKGAVQGEAESAGATCGVTAEHGTGVALWRRQEGCPVEAAGSLAWG